jgi:hypothetical protein
VTNKVLGISNRFSRASAPMRHTGYYTGLSATFKRSQNPMGVAIITLDEALDLIERKQKAIAARKHRDEGVVRHVAQGALFGLSRAHAKARSGKVKMPSFSIQKSDA